MSRGVIVHLDAGRSSTLDGSGRWAVGCTLKRLRAGCTVRLMRLMAGVCCRTLTRRDGRAACEVVDGEVRFSQSAAADSAAAVAAVATAVICLTTSAVV